MIPYSPLILIGGHYGSGKTEIAVNLAIHLRASGLNVSLADLDIVNPYFRSFERRSLLEAKGIRLITGSLEGYADLPALPGEVLSFFIPKDASTGIIDLGGDPAGSRVLARYRDDLKSISFSFWFILNKMRRETADIEKAKDQLKAIESMAGQKVTAIINNTHLLQETTPELVRSGSEMAKELAEETGIPYLLTACEARLAPKLCDLNVPLLPLHRYMLKPWEQR